MENIRERIVSCAGRVWFCAKELLKWLTLAIITGVPCGIIGAAFDLAVEHVTELRTEHTAILFLLPVIGLARALLCRWAAPSAGGPAACCT